MALTTAEKLIIKAFKIDPETSFNAIKDAIVNASYLSGEQKIQIRDDIIAGLQQSPQLRDELRPLALELPKVKALLGLDDSTTLAELQAALEAIPHPGA